MTDEFTVDLLLFEHDLHQSAQSMKAVVKFLEAYKADLDARAEALTAIRKAIEMCNSLLSEGQR